MRVRAGLEFELEFGLEFGLWFGCSSGLGSGAEILPLVVRAGVGSAAGTEAEGQRDVPPEVTSPVHGEVLTLHRLAWGRVRGSG